MAVSYMDFTSPNVRYTYDVNKNPFFKKDQRNYINSLSVKELNTLGNASLLDIHLSTGNVVEPHIHQNASELVYVISGAATVSLVNPFTKELLNFTVTPGQVAMVPQGWWHYEMATVDNTHLIAIFDAPIPEFIGGSDLLRLTPPSVLAHTYCLDEATVKEALAPITDTVFIGPPTNCGKPHGQVHGQMIQQHPSHRQQPDNQAAPLPLDYEQFQQQQLLFQQQQDNQTPPPLDYEQFQQQQQLLFQQQQQQFEQQLQPQFEQQPQQFQQPFQPQFEQQPQQFQQPFQPQIQQPSQEQYQEPFQVQPLIQTQFQSHSRPQDSLSETSLQQHFPHRPFIGNGWGLFQNSFW